MTEETKPFYGAEEKKDADNEFQVGFITDEELGLTNDSENKVEDTPEKKEKIANSFEEKPDTVSNTTPFLESKHIITFDELLSMKKSASRPSADTSVNGSVERPTLDNLTKSHSPVVKMGRGVDPHKVVENDWAEYNLYMSKNKF